MEYAADSATPAMNEEETLQAAQLIESESQLKEVVKASDKRPDYVPGALVRVKVDQNHWLNRWRSARSRGNVHWGSGLRSFEYRRWAQLSLVRPTRGSACKRFIVAGNKATDSI